MSVIHQVYLPFTEDVLSQHFAKVKSGGEDRQKYVAHYRASLAEHQRLLRILESGGTPTPQDISHGRQFEKDERFWIATALLGIHYAAGTEPRTLLGELMTRMRLAPPEGHPTWPDALGGRLHLYFEVNLPSPPSYKEWLRQHVAERVAIPYVREAADKAKHLEGSTKVDAMILAPETGVAIVFEAKVLSDISTTVRFDIARNQLARVIDVTLETNNGLEEPLSARKPACTYTVLVTPRALHPGGSIDGAHLGRLYGWLLPAYQEGRLLPDHLRHRAGAELDGVHRRLGWTTWEDVDEVLPGACPWLAERR